MITFTPAQLIGAISTSCALIMAVAGVLTLFASLIKKAKAPSEAQAARLDKAEADIVEITARLDDHDRKLAHDNQADGVILRCLLALIRHALDGNNIDALKDAEKSLNEYLTR